MKVVLLDSNLEDKYQDFLEKNSYSLFYYSLKFKYFLEALLSCQSHYFVCLKFNSVVGIFPLMGIFGRYGYVYNSLPFYGSYGGPLAFDRQIYSILISEYNHFLSLHQNLASSVVVLNPFLDESIFSNIVASFYDQRVIQYTFLSFDSSDPSSSLMSTISPSARRNIKKAIKSGIKVFVDNSYIPFLKKIHYENMASIGGRPKPESFFDLFPQFFTEDKDYNLYVAFLDGIPVAALLLFYYKDVVEYYIPVIVNSFRPLQPLSLIIYQAMLDSFKKGFRLWNWGGTWLSQSGVYKFKKKWASRENIYSYFIYVSNNDLYGSSSSELRSEYSNFYVLPFELLRRNKCQGRL